MPILIPRELPAFDNLTKENIFIMSDECAIKQDIRPLEIAILNLMPTKIETETQLLRLLGNTPLQVNITLIKTDSYKSKNVSETHLNKFYKNLEQIKKVRFDGMLITGAPVETMDFEKVTYWKELCEILDFISERVTSAIFICWGAQAAMCHYYGIQKKLLPEKLFGVFDNKAEATHELLLKGMDDIIKIPHSRYTTVDERAVRACEDLRVLASSDEAGLSIVKSKDNRRVFMFGHSEYDCYTLKNEYERDVKKGLAIGVPKHYFVDDKCCVVHKNWASATNLLYYNWLNYYVYQATPYVL